LKDAGRMHQKDDAEEKDFIAADTRSHRHATAPSKADSTATSKKCATFAATKPVAKRPAAVHQVMYTKGKDVPLDHPLAVLPELVMCQTLIHHKISFPTPSSWFPGVPTTLERGVRLHPTHAHKIGKSRAMLFCKLDNGFSGNSSIIATSDKAFNSFQFEARGPIASGEQGSIIDALYAWKLGQSTLQQFGVKACGYTLAPKKATNLFALHATLGAQFGTKFFSATALTTLPDPDTSNHSLQCDMFEPDPKHRGAMLRTELAPEWIKSEHVEMDGLWRRGALEKVLRSSLDTSACIFGSRFHYKIKRQVDMSLDKLRVRLVLQGQHMKQGVDYEHSYSPVPHASGFRTMLALATAEDMLIDHVNISQAFLPLKATCSKRKGLKATCSPHLLQVMVRMQNMSITSAHRYTVPAPAVGHGTKPCQL